MSYEIVYSINEKEHKITYATNNIRPLIIEQYVFKNKDKTDITDDEFIKIMLRNIIEGNFHTPKNHRLTKIAELIKGTTEYKDFDEKLWNWNDTYTEEYMRENWKQNSEDFDNYLLYMFNKLTNKKIIKEEQCFLFNF